LLTYTYGYQLDWTDSRMFMYLSFES